MKRERYLPTLAPITRGSPSETLRMMNVGEGGGGKRKRTTTVDRGDKERCSFEREERGDLEYLQNEQAKEDVGEKQEVLRGATPDLLLAMCGQLSHQPSERDESLTWYPSRCAPRLFVSGEGLKPWEETYISPLYTETWERWRFVAAIRISAESATSGRDHVKGANPSCRP